jgi:phosphatidylglycerol---prolipoprotein diacylglyceryl transferase
VGYAVLRFIAEFFRTPDPGFLSGFGFGLSTAQWLCVPMLLFGLFLGGRLWVKRHHR